MNNQSKGFTFKVAQNNKTNGAVKAREGVALAGCTLKAMPWGGSAPAFDRYVGGSWERDGGAYC